MWHGEYDQSITSAAQAPHSTNITGTITFRPLHLCRGREDRERERDDESRTESHDALTDSPAGYDVAAEIERDSTFCVSRVYT